MVYLRIIHSTADFLQFFIQIKLKLSYTSTALGTRDGYSISHSTAETRILEHFFCSVAAVKMYLTE